MRQAVGNKNVFYPSHLHVSRSQQFDIQKPGHWENKPYFSQWARFLFQGFYFVKHLNFLWFLQQEDVVIWSLGLLICDSVWWRSTRRRLGSSFVRLSRHLPVSLISLLLLYVLSPLCRKHDLWSSNAHDSDSTLTLETTASATGFTEELLKELLIRISLTCHEIVWIENSLFFWELEDFFFLSSVLQSQKKKNPQMKNIWCNQKLQNNY